eukprot:GHVU01106884.1.p1 GENE.GHVU01106884.1~~GHVU01106884.1.p1  ORF type:complete len:247 (+),score=41.67 GHVU01106884.1:176-916(+)
MATPVNAVTCEGCKKRVVTNLTCPTCTKLGLGDAYFCNQECYAQIWPEHKGLHKHLRQVINNNNQTGHATMKTYKEDDMSTWMKDVNLKAFKGTRFTGPLRPWPTPAQRRVDESQAPLPDYAKDPNYGRPASEERVRGSHVIQQKTPEELQNLRESCLLAREALDVGARLVRPGVTTEEIDVAIHNHIVSHGGYPSPLNYYKFPKSCCTYGYLLLCVCAYFVCVWGAAACPYAAAIPASIVSIELT